jgi:hypothetical protein
MPWKDQTWRRWGSWNIIRACILWLKERYDLWVEVWSVALTTANMFCEVSGAVNIEYIQTDM